MSLALGARGGGASHGTAIGGGGDPGSMAPVYHTPSLRTREAVASGPHGGSRGRGMRDPGPGSSPGRGVVDEQRIPRGPRPEGVALRAQRRERGRAVRTGGQAVDSDTSELEQRQEDSKPASFEVVDPAVVEPRRFQAFRATAAAAPGGTPAGAQPATGEVFPPSASVAEQGGLPRLAPDCDPAEAAVVAAESGYLEPCARCAANFPIVEMRAHRMQMLCKGCFRMVAVDPVHGPPPPVACIDGQDAHDAAPREEIDTSGGLWPAYTELRRRIDAGENGVALRKEAGRLASQLGLHFEAVEHYRHAVVLDPHDEMLANTLENVQRAMAKSDLMSDAAPRAAEERLRKIPEEAPPFWMRLDRVVTYPLRGRGLGVVLVGGICFGFGEVIARVNIIFGWLVYVGLIGYVAGYLFEVINSSAAGKDQPPDMPEPASFLESYLFPFFSFVGCLCLAYLPAILSGYMMFKGWIPPVVGGVLMAAGAVFGIFVFPMTLTVQSMFQSMTEAANYKLVFGSIGRILPDYILAFAAICAAWIAYAVGYTGSMLALGATLGLPTADAFLATDGTRLVSWVLHTVLTWPLFLYVWLFQGHVLGRLYRQGVRRLAWFVPPTEETARARRLSAGVAVAGMIAGVLVCAAAWGAWALIGAGQWLGGKGMLQVGRTSECPLPRGSKLTYFWQHTDGMAGLSTFDFYGVDDETLRVRVSSVTAGDFDSGPTTSIVGEIDSTSGLMTQSETFRQWGTLIHPTPGIHNWFYGPKDVDEGDDFVNGWEVRSEVVYRDTWDAVRVHDPVSTTDFYYDRRTGVLVGRVFKGVGFSISEYLVSAQGVPGLRNGPPSPMDLGTVEPSAPVIDVNGTDGTDEIDEFWRLLEEQRGR